MTTAIQTRSLATLDTTGRVRIPANSRQDVCKAMTGFIDSLATSTGQSTYYNSREEQSAALEALHAAVYKINRGLYAAFLTLPGVRDLSVQKGIMRLLEDHSNDADSLLEPHLETLVLTRLAGLLPPQRMFKLYGLIREKGINNRRTRTLILSSILSSESLELWAVKYRLKMKVALTHAWGRNTTLAIRYALETSPRRRSASQLTLLRKNLIRWVSNRAALKDIEECVYFVLSDASDEVKYSLPLLKKFDAAKADLSDGKGLPKEVLEGIRGRYHPRADKAVVLELSQDTMTEKQKMHAQGAAKAAGVKLEFNPNAMSMVDLYVYILQEGFGDQQEAIKVALQRKAARAAAGLQVRYAKVGVLLDSSVSMFGHETAKRRPLAIALAMRDVLVASATDKAKVLATSGKIDKTGLIQPCGATSLANGLVDLLDAGVDAVYLITDGYENAPAGRVNEVMQQVRRLDIETPVYQVSPVIGAEVAAVRPLSDKVSVLPVGNPESLGLSVIRAVIDSDPEGSIMALVGEARKLIGGE